ncbi:hypothetical protein [Nocardioides litoris]|uniref:hypothetical protein n=1 Tax=Nocardioides litoris TaxID=1926648 RepID=UPI0011244D79|nr:hypothetical protein [Nocardioides litoris]
MRDPEDFDAFYVDARERLLAQTYALTGDLAASRRAVRDAFVVAWHRWRKLSRLEDPESVVRPHAWRLAQRRHTARVWHREKDVPDDVRATLDALNGLSPVRRRVLVLTQLAPVSLDQMAREVGLPREQAERELQAGAAALALALDTEALGLRTAFDRLAGSVGGAGRWPRTTIIRRQGAARRRVHTVVGAAVAVAAVVVSGSAVTATDGVAPRLDQPPVALPLGGDGSGSAIQAVVTLPDTTLLDAAALDASYPGRRWTQVRTNDNSSGNGLVLPCQQDRYADPRGRAALVRTFDGLPRQGGAPKATVVQLSEASASERAAARAFQTTVGWFAGCATPRVQLLGTRTPGGVADESVQLVLRSWAAPVTTYVVGVARTGSFTTTTSVALPGSDAPGTGPAAALLAAGVTGLCAEPGAGACAEAQPELVDRAPVPTGTRPALLSELDLPPVNGVDQPWVGTEPSRPTTNAAATGCDRTTFASPFEGTRISRAFTRTFLVPEADLPQEFGVTETVGALPPRKAQALVQQVRDRMASCPDRDLSTEVERVTEQGGEGSSLDAWRLEVRVTDERTVVFWMAVARVGTAVAQLGFVPAPDATLADGAFVALAERARARLAEMPPPATG